MSGFYNFARGIKSHFLFTVGAFLTQTSVATFFSLFYVSILPLIFYFLFQFQLSLSICFYNNIAKVHILKYFEKMLILFTTQKNRLLFLKVKKPVFSTFNDFCFLSWVWNYFYGLTKVRFLKVVCKIMSYFYCQLGN